MQNAVIPAVVLSNRLEQFTSMLKEIFGDKAQHRIYADFEPLDKLQPGTIPAYYIHVIEKK